MEALDTFEKITIYGFISILTTQDKEEDAQLNNKLLISEIKTNNSFQSKKKLFLPL